MPLLIITIAAIGIFILYEKQSEESVLTYEDLPEPPESVIEKAVMKTKEIFGTKYDPIIRGAADTYGLDYGILWRLLYTESRFRDDIITGVVTSPVGAMGIAQFMPATAREELGSVEAALDPEIAIPGAARYLAKLIRSTGDISKGVAAYNWGIGNVKRKWDMPGAIPLETRNYVAAITGETVGDLA